MALSGPRLCRGSAVDPANRMRMPCGSTLRRQPPAYHDYRRLVIPVAVTAGDKIEGLRPWASGRCLSADQAGVYSRSEGGGG